MIRGCIALGVLAACEFAPGRLPSDGGPSPDVADGSISVDADESGDTDGDGITNGADNCPLIANVGQADEDADDVGNACDNCPHVANPGQGNDGETQNGQLADTVGDACDPRPQVTGERIALFLPFDSADDIVGWQIAGSNAAFSVSGGRLEQTGATDLGILWKNDLDLADAWITTEVTYGTIDGTKQFRGVSVMARFVRTNNFGYGVGCGEMRDTAYDSDAPFFNMVRFNGSGYGNLAYATPGAIVQTGHVATYTVHHVPGSVSDYECTVAGVGYTGTRSLTEGDGNGINLAVWGVNASFRFLVAIVTE